MTLAINNSLKVPGPEPLPIVGRMLNSIRFAKDSIDYAGRLFQQYGSVASLAEGGGTNLYSPYPGCVGTVLAQGPECIRAVATQSEIYHKCPLSARIYRLRDRSERTEPIRHFGVGLFGMNDQHHRQNRKLMLPAFHKQRLAGYMQDMIAITDSELARMQPGESCEIAQMMQRLTLRIATRTLFGEDIAQGDYGTGQLMQDTFRVQGEAWTNLLPFDIPGLPFHHYLNLLSKFEQRMQDIIDHKQNGDQPDILSMLIRARYEETGLKLTQDELLGHVGVIFAAGHDTSANALNWTLFLLSQHPQVMADLLDELESVLQGNPPTMEQLTQLPFLERVIKESMRVLAPVPWNGRVTSQPTQLGGYDLPQGTEVFISIYHTHHLPELYPDPEAFNPYRWETIDPNSYEYNPFSAGSRICIGAGFAMLEIKVVLAMLLQRFRLEYIPAVPIDRTGFIVIRPKHGMLMKVHRQDRQFTQGIGKVEGNIREMVKLA
ncbi:MAG: cytochrome P450 [Microcoleaceae cyanobacterium]